MRGLNNQNQATTKSDAFVDFEQHIIWTRLNQLQSEAFLNLTTSQEYKQQQYKVDEINPESCTQIDTFVSYTITYDDFSYMDSMNSSVLYE